jgi:hypothetical protein
MEVLKNLCELLHVISRRVLPVGFHLFQRRNITESVEIGHISSLLSRIEYICQNNDD